VLADGASTEFALVGNCGMVGISTFMGDNSTSSRAVVVTAGHAYRLKRRVLKREFALGGELQHLLLRYTQALTTQIALSAVCNLHHTVEQRLCRWLLLSLDRQSSNELHMTQELIANMLGVRREGITEAATRLRDAGMIQYQRGRITVLNRPGLERQACECYAVAETEANRLLSTKPVARVFQAARWVGGAFLTA
jgi:CRP-like cAMP-binding protein